MHTYLSRNWWLFVAPFCKTRDNGGMGICPYTFVKGFLKPKSSNTSEARELRVIVYRNSIEKVNVTLPARSARWLIDLIPDDVMKSIREEQIPIDDIQKTLAQSEKLYPCEIFHLIEENRSVKVWLE